MRNLIKIFSQYAFFATISVLAISLGCQQIVVSEPKQADFKVWVHVLSDKISVSIVNISSNDMLLEVSNMGIGYLMKYESTTRQWVVFDDSFCMPTRADPYSGLHILEASRLSNPSMTHSHSIFSFTIEKPNDFLTLQFFEVIFRAIPLSNKNALVIKNAHDVECSKKQYRLSCGSFEPK